MTSIILQDHADETVSGATDRRLLPPVGNFLVVPWLCIICQETVSVTANRRLLSSEMGTYFFLLIPRKPFSHRVPSGTFVLRPMTYGMHFVFCSS